LDPLPPRQDGQHQTSSIHDPITGEQVLPVTRATWRRRPKAYLASHRYRRPNPRTSVQRTEFYVFDERALRRPRRNESFYLPPSTLRGGRPGTPVRSRGQTAVYKVRYKGAVTSRTRPVDPLRRTCVRRSPWRGLGPRPGPSRSRRQAPRGGNPAAGRESTTSSTRCSPRPNDPPSSFKYIVKNRGLAPTARPATLFMPKPIFRRQRARALHGPLVAVGQGGQPRLFYDEAGYGRGLSDIRPRYLHNRRHPQRQPRRCSRFTQPDGGTPYHRLVPGFEGAGQPGLYVTRSATAFRRDALFPITGSNPKGTKARRVSRAPRPPPAIRHPLPRLLRPCYLAGLDWPSRTRIEARAEPIDQGTFYELAPRGARGRRPGPDPPLPGRPSTRPFEEADQRVPARRGATSFHAPTLIETWNRLSSAHERGDPRRLQPAFATRTSSSCTSTW